MRLDKKKTFVYSHQRKERSIKGLKVYQMPMAKDMTTVKYYDLYSERWQLARTTESDYYENQTEPVTIITEYDYNNTNLLANYEKIIDNKNNIIEKEIRYPLDANSSIYEKMKERHMINVPIETIMNRTANNEKTEIYRIHKQYFQDVEKTKNLILLGKVESSRSGISDLRTDVTFERYDQKGNIVHNITINGESTIFLWGYNGQYPIAEIRNATYTEVENAAKKVFSVLNLESFLLLSMTTENEIILKNGNLQKELPNAQVTTYTYKPLVGMKSMTTSNGEMTTYEYDSLGRLATIKDHNGKTAKYHDYHYQNQ